MKKAFYVFCATILGILIAIIVLSLIERVYLIQMISSGDGIPDTVNILGLPFFLPLVVVYLILVLGAIGGVLAGFRWWQFVYVDKLYKRLRIPKRIHPFGNIASEKKHRVIKSVKASKIAKVSKTKKVAKKTKVTKVSKPKTKTKPKTKPKKK